jgi:hypothetical protein
MGHDDERVRISMIGEKRGVDGQLDLQNSRRLDGGPNHGIEYTRPHAAPREYDLGLPRTAAHVINEEEAVETSRPRL